MARIDSLANFLEDVATKIRSKTGSQSTITPANYDTEIEKIAYKPSANQLVLLNNNNLIIKGVASSSQKSVIKALCNADDTTSIDLKNIDFSNIKCAFCMFYNKIGLTSIDLSNEDFSNCTDTSYMFYNCRNLETITFGNSFANSSVVNAEYMFANKEISIIESIDLSNFPINSIENMHSMFSNNPDLETITFKNNSTFESINTIFSLQNTFQNCSKLDNNTLNQILYLCTTTTEEYTGTKTLAQLGINDTFDNYANIPNLSNYQDFLDAGWTIS